MKKLAAAALVVVMGTASAAAHGQWWRWGRPKSAGASSSTGACDAANVAAGASNCPLLTVNDLVGTNQGGFRWPNTETNGQGFYLGPIATAYRTGGTMYGANRAAGSDFKYVAEVTIPALVNSSNVNSLNYATFVAGQGFVDPTEGQYTEAAGCCSGLWGLLVDETNSRLLGTIHVPFDANNDQRKSHWSRPLSLSNTGNFKGIDQFFSGFTGMVSLPGYTGFTSGYLANVPPEWQTALGGSVVSGIIPPSIVSRGSYGPVMGAFDPTRIGSGLTEPHPWQALVLYDSLHQTLGAWDSPTVNPYYSASDSLGGAALINGTRTAAIIGVHGTGVFCYGKYTPDPELDNTPSDEPGYDWCYDPWDAGGHGQHNQPYVYFIWLYDMLDFKKVVDGTVNPSTGQPWKPWDVVPYDSGSFTFPIDPYVSGGVKPNIAGVSYDATNKHLYITPSTNDDEGGIHVWDRSLTWRFLVNAP